MQHGASDRKKAEPIVGIPDGKCFISETKGRGFVSADVRQAIGGMFTTIYIDEEVVIETLRQLEKNFGLTYKINQGSTNRNIIHLEDNGMKLQQMGWYNGKDSETILKKADDVVSFGEDVEPYIEFLEKILAKPS